jgi:hypothetical protein
MGGAEVRLTDEEYAYVLEQEKKRDPNRPSERLKRAAEKAKARGDAQQYRELRKRMLLAQADEYKRRRR